MGGGEGGREKEHGREHEWGEREALERESGARVWSQSLERESAQVKGVGAAKRLTCAGDCCMPTPACCLHVCAHEQMCGWRTSWPCSSTSATQVVCLLLKAPCPVSHPHTGALEHWMNAWHASMSGSVSVPPRLQTAETAEAAVQNGL